MTVRVVFLLSTESVSLIFKKIELSLVYLGFLNVQYCNVLYEIETSLKTFVMQTHKFVSCYFHVSMLCKQIIRSEEKKRNASQIKIN